MSSEPRRHESVAIPIMTGPRRSSKRTKSRPGTQHMHYSVSLSIKRIFTDHHLISIPKAVNPPHEHRSRSHGTEHKHMGHTEHTSSSSASSASEPVTKLMKPSTVRPPSYSPSSTLPLTKRRTVGYPSMPYFSAVLELTVQSISASLALEPFSLSLEAASSEKSWGCVPGG